MYNTLYTTIEYVYHSKVVHELNTVQNVEIIRGSVFSIITVQ